MSYWPIGKKILALKQGSEFIFCPFCETVKHKHSVIISNKWIEELGKKTHTIRRAIYCTV